MNFSVAGIPDLDNRLRSDRAVDLIRWLRAGFAELTSEDLRARAAAFPPLILAPERELLGQLGTALREAKAARLKGPDRLRSVVFDHLSHADTIKSEAIGNLIYFWQLLASVGCESSIFASARYFLEEVLRTKPASIFGEGSTARLSTLTHSVVGAVATSSPMGTVQLSFLEFVRGRKELWDDSFVDLLIDCSFSSASMSSRRLGRDEGNARIRIWQNLRKTLSDDLRRRADPNTAVGRALLRSIARYLDVKGAPSRTRAEVAILRDRLWALNNDNAEPIIQQLEPSRELELA